MPKTCQTCGQSLDVERDAINGLSIGCSCERTPIRVSKAFPPEWEA